jgi:parallel beta-helix repeat protein
MSRRNVEMNEHSGSHRVLDGAQRQIGLLMCLGATRRNSYNWWTERVMASSRILLVMVGCVLSMMVSSICHASEPAVYNTCDTPSYKYAHKYNADPANINDVIRATVPGDIVYLSDGDYGALTLSRNNAAYVYVVAADNQHPMFSSISMSGSHWLISGLTITGYSAPELYPNGWQRHQPLVYIEGGDDFIVEHNAVSSAAAISPWVEEIRGAVAAHQLSNGIEARNAGCVSIQDNHVYNIFNAIVIGGDQVENNGRKYIVSGNAIDNFAGNGIDHSVSDAIISGNAISNAHSICHNLCVHQDGIQGWNYQDRSGLTNTNIDIMNNTIIVRTTRDVDLPADLLQGITIFDGNWDGVRILNNVVVVNAWHGISVYGPKNVLIANNTVIGNSERDTWIMVTNQNPEYGGKAPSNVVVRNNLATKFVVEDAVKNGDHVVADHNMEVVYPKLLFKAFDPKNGTFDLHLRPNIGAARTGVKIPSVAEDIEGKPRSDRPDLGAYNFK